MKDPAFLFYSQDFYAATRDMLPEERACYIDLLIYQHQKGPIPTDTRRVLMFCSGITEAVLQAVLQAKFKHTDKGWVNERLEKVISDRGDFLERKSRSGQLGQFLKRAKSALSASKYKDFRKFVMENGGDEYVIMLKAQLEGEPEAMLQAVLKHIENENENDNTISDDDSVNDKTRTREVVFPFGEYFKSQWDLWKQYKLQQHRFKYKSPATEQAALKQLQNMAQGQEQRAVEILHFTMANGWKGFVLPRANSNRQTIMDMVKSDLYGEQ